MSNIISSAIFCARNADKAERGQIGRAAPAAGQAKKVYDYISVLDNSIGKGTREAVNIFKSIIRNETALKYIGQAVDFASKNVNPLICASSGLDVLLAKDKESALVTNAAALASMFGVEHLMKKYLDEIPKIKGIDKIAQKIINFSKTGGKYTNSIPAIIHGIAFVTGSCTAYGLGDKFGRLLLGSGSTKAAKGKK